MKERMLAKQASTPTIAFKALSDLQVGSVSDAPPVSNPQSRGAPQSSGSPLPTRPLGLSASTGALPMSLYNSPPSSRDGLASRGERGVGSNVSRFSGPLPMMRLVQGFNMQPVGLPARLYPVDYDIIGKDAYASRGSPSEHLVIGAAGETKLRRLGKEYNVGVGARPIREQPFGNAQASPPVR